MDEGSSTQGGNPLLNRLSELPPEDVAANYRDLAKVTPTLSNIFKAFVATKKAEGGNEFKDVWRSMHLFRECCESFGWNLVLDAGDQHDAARFCELHRPQTDLLQLLYQQFFENYLVDKISLRPNTVQLIVSHLTAFTRFLHSPPDLNFLPEQDVENLLQLCKVEAKTLKRSEKAKKIGRDFATWAKSAYGIKDQEIKETDVLEGYFDISKILDDGVELTEFTLDSPTTIPPPWRLRLPGIMLAHLLPQDQLHASLYLIPSKGFFIPLTLHNVYPEGSATSSSQPPEAFFDKSVEPRGFEEGTYDEQFWKRYEEEEVTQSDWEDLEEEEEGEDDDVEMEE
ncbi:hypothetical protein BT69DRAFT_1355390 [Atractiella rhizophila]|nr:hypothetical protein BT69DRAFT_1355390 [Atractiella rhizophila]